MRCRHGNGITLSFGGKIRKILRTTDVLEISPRLGHSEGARLPGCDPLSAANGLLAST